MKQLTVGSRGRAHMACVLVALMAWTAAPARALEIAQVQHEPASIDVSKAQKVTIRFRLSEPAKVTARIFDGRDLQVRTLTSGKPLAAGEGALAWDGRDEAGRPVPPEAYHYTLEAVTEGGARVEYDVTDYTGGDDLTATAVQWAPETRTVTYYLPQIARVNIRAALKNGGPLLGTVVDWVARPAGKNAETWDGVTAGTLDLASHPQLDLVVTAFSLPQNTILVGPPAARVELLGKTSWPAVRRVVKRTPQKRMFAHSQQSLEEIGDFRLSLHLPSGLSRSEDGLPVVAGTVPLRVEIADEDRDRAVTRRFEAVFFLDGQFAFENEVGFLPMTVHWKLDDVNDGVHYLTVNIRGYEGNFGSATEKVKVDAAALMKTPSPK